MGTTLVATQKTMNSVYAVQMESYFSRQFSDIKIDQIKVKRQKKTSCEGKKMGIFIDRKLTSIQTK